MAASKPAPAMTANRSPLKRPTSKRCRCPRRPSATACGMSFGIPRFDANRLAVPAGMIARSACEPGEDVDAPLNHPVAAPGEHELGALVESALYLRGRLPALRDLGPEEVGDAARPRADGGARAAHRRASCPSAPRRRPSSGDSVDAGPLRRPPRAGEDDDAERGDPDQRAAGHVERIVHSRGTCATARRRSGSPPRPTRRRARKAAIRILEVRSSTRPPYTAIEAAVWPDG